jgi:hypothetical protein
MKAFLALVLAGAAAAALRADAPRAVPPGGPAADLASRFDLIGENYKKAAVVLESVFNPFRIQSAEAPGGSRRDPADITNEAIVAAVEHRRVSGVLLAPVAANNRVIIGDEVFAVGDPLEFFDLGAGATQPLVAGVSVTVREIRTDRLALDVGRESEAPRRVDFPLRTFWRP